MKRSDKTNSEDLKILNQLLTELDGVSDNKDITAPIRLLAYQQIHLYPCYPAFCKNQKAFRRNTHKNHLM